MLHVGRLGRICSSKGGGRVSFSNGNEVLKIKACSRPMDRMVCCRLIFSSPSDVGYR